MCPQGLHSQGLSRGPRQGLPPNTLHLGDQGTFLPSSFHLQGPENPCYLAPAPDNLTGAGRAHGGRHLLCKGLPLSRSMLMTQGGVAALSPPLPGCPSPATPSRSFLSPLSLCTCYSHCLKASSLPTPSSPSAWTAHAQHASPSFSIPAFLGSLPKRGSRAISDLLRDTLFTLDYNRNQTIK